MNFITELIILNSVQSSHCASYQLMFVPHTNMLDLLQMLHICMTLISFMNTWVFIQFTLAKLCQLYLSITDLRGMRHDMDTMSCAQSVPKASGGHLQSSHSPNLTIHFDFTTYF